MQRESMRQLYVDELRDLYNAETQLVKALPKMAKASSNSELRLAFEEHLRQTSEQVSRLEQIFDMLEEKPTGKKCLGMDGLVKEAAETMREKYASAVMDAGIAYESVSVRSADHREGIAALKEKRKPVFTGR